MALGRSPTPPEIRSPERDRAEDAEVAEAEEEFGDAFDIPHKNASLDHLRRWRQDALVLNASRRFRYTLDLKKEEEKEMIRRKIRAHAQVIRAAFLSKEAGEKDLRDWLDSGRGGWNEGSGNSRREGLMPYKQFMQELEDDVSPVEAQCRYEEYVTTQKKTYFDLHKNEDWLRNKYHPTCVESVVERRNELARTTANEFFQELQSGSFDTGPGLTSSAANKSGNNSGLNLEDVDANGKKGKLGKGPDDLYYAAPKAHPVSSEARRIRIDIEHAQALICKLDSEKGIENNVLLSSDHDQADRDKSHGSMGPIVIIRGSSTVMGLEGVELLDTLVTYLWRIHGVDYYGMSETNEPKGLRHVKADSRTYNGASSNAAEWEKKLDSFWQDRIEGQDPLEILKAKEKIDAAANEVLDPHVRKIRDEKYGWKYGCGAKGCTKLFEASEFVQKHLKLKHADLVVELTSKVREDIYFENYMNDPKAPGGTPIMQQAAPREKGRHRPPMESRLRDERGNRRFDRNVDSPTHDGSSENPDDPMYDSYGDPVMHGAFPPDIPAPPVLMPVPGAAPLGPFVPAPREVAMRMLRDQGGPPPFEPTAGPRPRKAGRGGGPSMGGPSPVLAPPLPPPFLHDPRKIRSRMNPYPPGGFLSYLQNSSNFPLPREIPHQSPMPPVPAQPFIDVGSGDNDDASRTGKRLTWTQEEDLRLFSAWLNNSNDPINGNCKKNDQYWGEVTAMYNSTTPANRRREVKQAKDRWHRVNKKVGWFYASWLKANRIYASGQSDDQLMDEALKIYEEDYKEGQFMFMYCWKAVQDQPKWHAYIEKLDNLNKRKFSEFREAWEDLTSVEDTKDIPRPQGTKAAKAERKSKGKGKAMAATEVIDDMEEKLDKFLIALSEASKGRSDMVEVQQRMSTEKLQTAKEKKEVKMLDLYKGLFMHDTRGMPDDIKVEHMKALRSMREKLFGPSD